MGPRSSFFNHLYSLSAGLMLLPHFLWAGDLNLCKAWQDKKMDPKHWEAAYNGFGRLYFKEGIHLEPRAIASEPGTHAALALTPPGREYQDFVIKITYENIKALRAPAANTWEVFWLFFNYQKTKTGKDTNYFIFKPNGIELGTATNEIDQEFLFTSNRPQAEFGKTYDLTVMKKGQRVVAYIDGKIVMDFTAKPDKPLFDQSGQLGLYTEDAKVHIKNVSTCSAENMI